MSVHKIPQFVPLKGFALPKGQWPRRNRLGHLILLDVNLLPLRILCGSDVKPPQNPRYGEHHRHLGDVHARTYSSARPEGPVVAVVDVARERSFADRKCRVLALGIKHAWVGE